jgi:hypothetical protein
MVGLIRAQASLPHRIWCPELTRCATTGHKRLELVSKRQQIARDVQTERLGPAAYRTRPLRSGWGQITPRTPRPVALGRLVAQKRHLFLKTEGWRRSLGCSWRLLLLDTQRIEHSWA